mmetsp:Transcript_33678/g.32704  ORF Transcript_33678/g.32704 Transcript_33678/m.32704 type:complete len:168 (-) Transcript_33678:1537-2040(-)
MIFLVFLILGQGSVEGIGLSEVESLWSYSKSKLSQGVNEVGAYISQISDQIGQKNNHFKFNDDLCPPAPERVDFMAFFHKNETICSYAGHLNFSTNGVTLDYWLFKSDLVGAPLIIELLDPSMPNSLRIIFTEDGPLKIDGSNEGELLVFPNPASKSSFAHILYIYN